MTIDLKRFQQLQAAVEKAQSDADRAQGALDQLMAKLEAEYGCTTLEQAEKKLEELTSKSAAAEQTYNDALAVFEEEYGDLIGTQGTGR